MVKYQSRLVVYGNEENDYHDERFHPVADYTIAKMVTCMRLQQGWEINNLDFDNAFPIGRSNRLVYVELRKCVYID